MSKTSLLLALITVFSCISFAFPAYAAEKLPVAYYTFDYGNLSDLSGNGYHGKAAGGRALTFEGAEGRGKVLELNNKGLKRDANANGFQIPTDGLKNAEAFTLVMDIYVETDGGNQVWFDLSRGKSGVNGHHYLVGLLAISNYGINSELSTTALSKTSKVRAYNKKTYDKAGEWAQLAYVNDGGMAYIYLNGKLVASKDQAYSVKDMLTVSGVTLTIGMPTYWNDLSLDAKLDNVAVYDYALSVSELSDPPVPDTVPADVPTEAAEPIGDVYFPELGANGLIAEYYTLNEKELSFGEPIAAFAEWNINYPDMSRVMEERTGKTDYVAARWTGRIVAPESGYYTFSAYSDNGIRLYIDGKIQLDWWVNKWDVEQVSKPVYLEKGEAHTFVFEWFEYTGGAHVILRWENDKNVIKKPIPASAFYLPADSKLPVITEIDTSAATLDMNEGAVGGTVAVKGERLTNAEKFELVYRGGESLASPVYLNAAALREDSAVFELPTELCAGSYYIKPHYKSIVSRSDECFSVFAKDGEQMRTEHPDPSWQREDWINLNGWWNFAFDPQEVGKKEQWYLNKDYEYKINVPFCWESTLSGIAATDYRGQVWYNRSFTVDSAWLSAGRRIDIHFGAVDAKCTVYVNGKEVCSHDGGYTPFKADITDFVDIGENTVTVWVEDKASYGDNSYVALIGKQGHNAPCGYTHTSGIWQTVYLESRESTYVDYAHANSDYKDGSVQYDVSVISDKSQRLILEFDFESKIWNEALSKDVATGSAFTYSKTVSVKAGVNSLELDKIIIENAKLWSDREPNLYYGTVTVRYPNGKIIDSVSTYFGLRNVYTDVYDGRDYEYVFINGSPVFLAGLLDQGFWREGIYTAPSEEALKSDVAEMKKRGFNLLRKHIKIEDPLQYYWCDKLGMFVWQDMPHATAMNATAAGGDAPGRKLYDSTLTEVLARDYNKPSVIAVILFNETWGIKHTAPKASDGLTTQEWIKSLYRKVKAYNPGMLVEDMSPLNKDHIQPTDLNTFHMYPITYRSAKASVEKYANNSYEGSTLNFYNGYKQEKEPLLNSEYGGVGVSSGDRDVSLCFKYQTDLMRMNQRFNGYVYTEPYDIEYERNGILTYDRREKLFPYGEIAYGGDMTIADLNQPNHVGIYDEPARVCRQGSVYTADAVASNWSGNEYENAVLHWRFDATDVYGNYFSTGISGEQKISYAPYTAERYTLSFKLPDKVCVGTVTVWIEENGKQLAKNFINVIVRSENVKNEDIIGENSVALRTDGGSFEGVGELSLNYSLPDGYDAAAIDSIRLIAEISSVKTESVTNGIASSATSQTAIGGERPSDMTVYINGVKVDTVFIPDDPRDIRGTLTFNYSTDRNSSAEDFGYLVNISVPAEKIGEIRKAIERDGAVKVTYAVEAESENKNGLRIYNDKQGRYVLKPTVILNPTDSDGSGVLTSANYLVSAKLSDGDSISVRGGAVSAALKNGTLSLGGETVELGSGTHTVSVRTFDTRYQVFIGNDPVPVIDTYINTGYTSCAVSTTGEDLLIAPETYGAPVGDINGNGVVSLYDLLTVIHSIYTQNTYLLDNADANGDGEINVIDVVMLAKRIAGKY